MIEGCYGWADADEVGFTGILWIKKPEKSFVDWGDRLHFFVELNRAMVSGVLWLRLETNVKRCRAFRHQPDRPRDC